MRAVSGTLLTAFRGVIELEEGPVSRKIRYALSRDTLFSLQKAKKQGSAEARELFDRSSEQSGRFPLCGRIQRIKVLPVFHDGKGNM